MLVSLFKKKKKKNQIENNKTQWFVPHTSRICARGKTLAGYFPQASINVTEPPFKDQKQGNCFEFQTIEDISYYRKPLRLSRTFDRISH